MALDLERLVFERVETDRKELIGEETYIEHQGVRFRVFLYRGGLESSLSLVLQNRGPRSSTGAFTFEIVGSAKE